MSEVANEAAPSSLDVAREMVAEEAPAEESSPEETVAEEVQQETEIPNLDVEVPEDYEELGSMPDFDAEAEAEISNEEPESEGYYEEPDTAALRKRALAAEKRTAWLEKQHVAQNEKKWQAEAIKFYPLSEPFIKAGKIQADSRRAYAREAKSVHEAMKPFVTERFLKPLEEALKAKEEEVREEAVSEQAEQWGRPRTGPNQAPAASERKSAEYAGRQRGPTLVDEIKEMIFKEV